MPFSSGTLSFDNTSTNLLSGRTSSWATPSLSSVVLTSFNRGGTYVPNTGLSPNSSVPLTVDVGNSLSLNTLRGCFRYFTTSITFTVSTSYYTSNESTYQRNGFLTGSFGTVPSSNSFTTPTATYSFVGLYRDSFDNRMYIYLSASSLPANNDNTFVQVNSTNYSGGSYAARSSLTSFTHSANIRSWYTGYIASWPTSGTSTATFRFYG